MEVQKLQRYDLVERIAAGGMGEVFRARAVGPLGFEKTLAVKRILPELSSDREFVDRFVRESKLAVSLSHANLVQVFDLGRSGDDLFLVMEYVQGADLARLLQAARAAGHSIPIPIAIQIVAEAAQGLAYAHSRYALEGEAGQQLGVIHCDISPSNLLLSYAGEVKLTDFGVAQLIDQSRSLTRSGATQTQHVMGKWRYMAPEQIRGEPIDARTDLYALGVVLYEILTLRKAFAGDGVKATCDLVLTGSTTPVRELRPEIPLSLERLLQRLMAVDPRERLADARAVLMQLGDVQMELGHQVTALDVGALVRDLVPPVPESAPRSGLAALLQPMVVERTGSRGGSVVRRRTPAASFLARSEGTGSQAVTQWIPAGQAQGGSLRLPGGGMLRWDRQGHLRLGMVVAVLLTLLAGAGMSAGVRRWRAVPPPPRALVEAELGDAQGGMLGAAFSQGRPPAFPQMPVEPMPPGLAELLHSEASTPSLVAEGPAPAAPAATPSDRPDKPEHAARRRAAAFLDIYSEPWAEVAVDGRPLGKTTPLVKLEVRPGRHQLLLTNPVLHRHESLSVNLSEGQVQKIEVYLKE